MFELGADRTTGELLTLAADALCAAFARVSPTGSGVDDVESAADVLAQIEQLQGLINTATAVQTVRLAEHASTERVMTYDPEADVAEYRLGRGPMGRVRDTAAADVQAVLALGPVSARRRLARAVEAVAFTPTLLDLMGQGQLDRPRLEAVTDVLVDIPPHQRRQTAGLIEQELLWRGVAEQPPAVVRRWAQLAAYRACSEAEPAQRKRTMAERSNVVFSPGPIPGLSVMTATLPTQDAAVLQAAVEELAWRYHTAPLGAGAQQPGLGDRSRKATPPTLGQCRVDALRDLVMARASISTTATLVVPVRAWESPWALMGVTSDEPPEPLGWTEMDDLALEAEFAALESLGDDVAAPESPDPRPPEPRDDQHALAPPGDAHALDPPGDAHALSPPDDAHALDPFDDQHALDPSDDEHTLGGASVFGDVEIDGVGVIPADIVGSMLRAGGLAVRRALLDPRSGTLLTGAGSVGYSPSATLAEAVRLRDGRCRFPACCRPALRSDLDHVIAYDPTDIDAGTRADNLQTLCRAHHRAKQSGAWEVTMSPDGVCRWTAISGAQRVTYPQHHPLARAPF